MHVSVEYSDEELHDLLKLKSEQWGLLSKSPKNAPLRAGSAAGRLMVTRWLPLTIGLK